MDLTKDSPRSCEAEIPAIVRDIMPDVPEISSSHWLTSSNVYATSRGSRYVTLGDEDFFVMVTPSVIEVSCFDKDVHLPAEDTAYRVERERRMAQRVSARTGLRAT